MEWRCKTSIVLSGFLPVCKMVCRLRKTQYRPRKDFFFFHIFAKMVCLHKSTWYKKKLNSRKLVPSLPCTYPSSKVNLNSVNKHRNTLYHSSIVNLNSVSKHQILWSVKLKPATKERVRWAGDVSQLMQHNLAHAEHYQNATTNNIPYWFQIQFQSSST